MTRKMGSINKSLISYTLSAIKKFISLQFYIDCGTVKNDRNGEIGGNLELARRVEMVKNS